MGGDTHAAVRAQIEADAAEVDPQALHVVVLSAVVRQDVVQVEIQDIGVQAADLHVVLEEVRGQVLKVTRWHLRRWLQPDDTTPTWSVLRLGSSRTLGSSCSFWAWRGNTLGHMTARLRSEFPTKDQ